MAVHKNLFSPLKPLPGYIKDGDEIVGGNISQDEPDTVISELKNLTFRGVNMTRCRIEKTWTIDDCNISQCEKEPEPDYQEQAVKDSCKAVLMADYEKLVDEELSTITIMGSSLDVKSVKAAVLASAKLIEITPIKERP